MDIREERKILNQNYIDSLNVVNFKNCKYNNRELAYWFVNIAEKLLALYNSNTSTTVDFQEYYIIRSIYGLRASYAGFVVAVLQPDEIHRHNSSTCEKAIAHYLGFKNVTDLIQFITENTKVFGDEGSFIFTEIGQVAFGKDENSSITLLDIVEKHIQIADNLRLLGDI